MGILGPKALQAVIDLVTGGEGGGKTPTPFETYRSGTELESFLRRCGIDFYPEPYEARVPGTRRAIYAVNEDPGGLTVMSDIIETLAVEYAQHGDPIEMVEYLNQRLLLDGFHIVGDGGQYRLSRISEDFELADDVEDAGDGFSLDSVRPETDLGPDQEESEAEDKDPPSKKDTTMAMNQETGADIARDIFVVHGRDGRIKSQMFAFLRALDLKPLEWSELVSATGQGSPYIGEVLAKAFANNPPVLVLLTPDDEAKLRNCFLNDNDPEYEKTLTPQARPNVLFEAGMAMARCPDRTILVQIGQVRPFSDVAGRHVLHFDGSSTSRNELAQRLETAGCPVSRTGHDWLDVGDFSVGSQASEEMGLQTFLISKPFRLYYKPSVPEGHKRMVFAPDGKITEGVDDNEHTWRLRNQKLEFVHKDGHLFSRFAYDPKTRIFNNTGDADTKCRRQQYMKVDDN